MADGIDWSNAVVVNHTHMCSGGPVYVQSADPLLLMVV